MQTIHQKLAQSRELFWRFWINEQSHLLPEFTLDIWRVLFISCDLWWSGIFYAKEYAIFKMDK